MTTNAGRLRLSDPSPYVTHEPTQGCPIRGTPVFSMNRAGLWLLDSLKHEWTNAILSTCLPRLGKRSLTHFPEAPSRRHSKGDLISGPTSLVKKPVFLSNPTSSWPSRFASSGLWSQVSIWLGPPFMKSQMTALARGLCGGFLGAMGSTGAETRSFCSASKPVRATEPNPQPA
jgi:hypothetical protein